MTGVVLYGALLAAAVVFAEDKPPIGNMSIALDQIQPFPQPEAKSTPEKAAVKFKPQIIVSEGCYSFPAVNADGETTAGLKIEGISDGLCKGGEKGSQVYGRATWHREKWVVMYVWHFPRYHVDIYPADWEHVVLWLNNPAVANQTLEAVSVWEDEKVCTRKQSRLRLSLWTGRGSNSKWGRLSIPAVSASHIWLVSPSH